MLSISHGVGGARGRIIAQELGKSGKKFKIIGICDWFWVKNGQKWGKRSKKGLFCFFPLMFERKEATAPRLCRHRRSLSAWLVIVLVGCYAITPLCLFLSCGCCVCWGWGYLRGFIVGLRLRFVGLLWGMIAGRLLIAHCTIKGGN